MTADTGKIEHVSQQLSSSELSLGRTPILLGSRLVVNEDKASLGYQKDRKARSQIGDIVTDVCAGGSMRLLANNLEGEDTARRQPLRASEHRSLVANETRHAHSEKKELATRYMEAGDFYQAWEIYDDLGDRPAAQHALEQAYRTSKRDNGSKLWRTPMGTPTHDLANEQACMDDESGAYARQSPTTANGLKASEVRRPVSASSRASLPEFGSTGLAKLLRRVLGINQRKADIANATFQQWNQDRSGALSRSEFAEGVRTTQPFIADHEIEAAFSEADADGDGCIVQEQFVKWLLQA